MPKMQVYLPDELYARVKARGKSLNVSAILQRALEESLEELDRRKALDAAIRAYEKRHGKIRPEEVAAQAAADKAAARRPKLARGRNKKRAA